MDKNKLTNFRIGFALHGYENDILSWLRLTTNSYEVSNYSLKSVSYDIDYNKLQRKSLKTFYKIIEEDPIYPVDKLYSFTVFSGEKQKYPFTWHYGCRFDEPGKRLTLFFDSSYGEENILSFYNEFLKTLLKDRTIWGGYLFFQEKYWHYPSGGGNFSGLSQNFYKEDSDSWWKIWNSENGLGILNKKNQNLYRHIYKQNILSKHHMAEMFDGMLLVDWIEKNNYGTIKKIGMENWLWVVPEDKLYEIQVIFYNKKLLLGVN